jgi:hypothetical protein
MLDTTESSGAKPDPEMLCSVFVSQLEMDAPAPGK